MWLWIQTVALWIHDLCVLGKSPPSLGLSCLTCEMGWTVVPALASKCPCPPCSSVAFPLSPGAAVWRGLSLLSLLLSETRLGLGAFVLPWTSSYIRPYDWFLTRGLAPPWGLQQVQRGTRTWGGRSLCFLCRHLCPEPGERLFWVMAFWLPSWCVCDTVFLSADNSSPKMDSNPVVDA